MNSAVMSVESDKQDRFDVCVIGAGPAGFAAAMRCWDHGKKVCLVEKDRLGGAGIYSGALVSKTLWELSRDFVKAGRTGRGYTVSGMEVDYGQVLSCVSEAAADKTRLMEHQLSLIGDPSGHYRGSVKLIRGTAAFIDPHRVRIKSKGNEQVVFADYFVIASGSRPRIIDDIPVDDSSIVTSDHIMEFKRFPESIVIVGAGVVGCEFATIFANFGKTRVYLIDRAERILPFEDEDVSALCSRNLEARGVVIHHGASLNSISVSNGGVDYEIKYGAESTRKFTVEKALVSIGRVPNTEGLALEKAGVEVNERGYIVNTDTQTSVQHIYAAGDVTYDIALVNIGESEGRHAADRICGEACKPLSYDNVSTIMFLEPEVAAVGLNEIQAQKQKVPYLASLYSYSLIDRAIAMRATGGYMKILASDDDEKRVLGMRALGVHSSTTIEAVSLMISRQMSISALAELFHPHPAVTEGLRECVRVLTGNSLYKPIAFEPEIKCYRVRYDKDGKAIKREL